MLAHIEVAHPFIRQQGFFIYFTVRCHGHFINLHHHLRYHVLGKRSTQVMVNGLRVNRCFCAKIANQSLDVFSLVDKNCSSSHTGVGHHLIFDFTQLNSESIEFYLTVGSSKIDEFPFFVPSGHIAGVIHGLPLKEWACCKMTGCLFFLSPVSS